MLRLMSFRLAALVFFSVFTAYLSRADQICLGTLAMSRDAIASQFSAVNGSVIHGNITSLAPRNTLIVDECHYCGAPKCYIRSCPAVAADITAGRCARNADGQVTLPSGRFVPRSLPGRTMRERVL